MPECLRRRSLRKSIVAAGAPVADVRRPEADPAGAIVPEHDPVWPTAHVFGRAQCLPDAPLAPAVLQVGEAPVVRPPSPAAAPTVTASVASPTKTEYWFMRRFLPSLRAAELPDPLWDLILSHYGSLGRIPEGGTR